jgi:hypothetical protein
VNYIIECGIKSRPALGKIFGGKMKLGQRIKDKVSGFTGIAVSRTEFLNGCVRISIQPPLDKEGKLPDEKWFDIQQLEIIDEGISVASKDTGGPGSTKIPQGLRCSVPTSRKL